ncbi:sigma-70 family RNA polymerase sigma factor [Albirhodobacter sp. R86504]|uniref:sigma-70 family RNA polymerase sigma factor n=1 Tax=Albirhodobacter sp. R86504 TaxID=3093848 RepID=UPI00367010C4
MHDKTHDWSELLRAANAGDAKAYGLFLTSVTPVIRAVVHRRGGGVDAEDIVQEVLLAIHTRRQTWREEDPVAPWVYAIARHKVIDAFRKRGTRVMVPIEEFSDGLPAEPETCPTEKGDIDVMIARLEPRAAKVVRAIGVEGRSFAETGAMMEMTEGAVRVMLHRSLSKLAQLRERLIEI